MSDLDLNIVNQNKQQELDKIKKELKTSGTLLNGSIDGPTNDPINGSGISIR